MKKKFYYLLSVTGWETYEPHWFICSCSKKKFQVEVRKAIDKVIPSLHNDDYIDGHDLLKKVIPILVQKDIHPINPDFEISVDGEVRYIDDYGRPKIFSDFAWKAISEHNKKRHDELYKDLLKQKTRTKTRIQINVKKASSNH